MVPRYTLDSLWECLQGETDMWVGRRSKQKVSRPFPSTGHLREVERLTYTPGREIFPAFRLELQYQLTWFSDLWVWTRATSWALLYLPLCSVDVEASLQSCWTPSSWISLYHPDHGSFQAWWTGDELVLFLCLRSIVTAQGRAVYANPGASWSLVHNCARLFSHQWAGGTLGCCRVEQDWKRCADS